MTLRGVRAFRLIVQEPGDGRRNMAVDEALLESVGRLASPPALRLYGFTPPTLSLGRFQRARELLDLEGLKRDGLDLVRRPTGGQAVLHDRELTYAVVLSRGQLEPFTKREIYRFIAGLLLAGLERLGIRALSSQASKGSPLDPDCFRSTSEYEIADTAERKLIGSAQMLSRTGSLQHGAIPLDGSYRRIARYLRNEPGKNLSRPFLAKPSSLSEALGHEVGLEEAVEALRSGAAAALRRFGVELEPGELTSAESRRAEELLSAKYSRDEWNLAS